MKRSSALLHAASSAEIRNLRVEDFNSTSQTLVVGHRSLRVPVDPATATALKRCLEQRTSLCTHNPHIIVTTQTKTRRTPASLAYLSHVLDPAGVSPKRLRATRIIELLIHLDPKVVSEALGMNAGGLADYLADQVDAGRLPDPRPPNL